MEVISRILNLVLLVGLLAIPVALAKASEPNTKPMSWADNYVFSRPVLTYVSEPKLRLYTGNGKCSCVEYAKSVLEKEGEIWGNAGDILPNSNEPSIGSIVLLNEGKNGHIGVITYQNDTEFTITEANYKPCEITTRTLPRDYKPIRGYLKL